ncbi:MAG: endonuclease/exonuclease/phosphatase family protein [Breoghania sp.]|nr:endonuclease/exonuclease/phosphatase family protein [Breoghania sp.]MDJ0930473.1 endonuclease/exonuclease/phosphatase family protein [Breoghania sp.]
MTRLRPILEQLDADILCLQKVNTQRRKGEWARGFDALQVLIQNTSYESFHLATSGDGDPTERHNLAILSRYPVIACRDILNDYIDPPHWRRRHAHPPDKSAPAIHFDRPILAVSLDLPENRPLHLFCVHLRAPLTAPVPGQKLTAKSWKSVPGWAEGYFAAAMKRTGQALELREAVDAVFDKEEDAFVAAVGDFNAVEVEPALRIILAELDDTGNCELASRELLPVESFGLKRTSFHGQPSRPSSHARPHPREPRTVLATKGRPDSHNRNLADEIEDAGTPAALGSFHAPLVATFDELETP